MAAIGRHCVSTPTAPRPVGPYSQAVVIGDMVYMAGQIGLDPQTGQLVPGGIMPETEQALKNLTAVLDSIGSSLANVVKVTVMLTNIAEFEAMNGVYARHFSANFPARAAFSVVALAKNARVEIEATAVLGQISDIKP